MEDRLTDAQYQSLLRKIDKEFPIRLKLAELAGRPKINPKNYNALMAFDSTIPELFLEVALNKPENLLSALSIIRGD